MTYVWLAYFGIAAALLIAVAVDWDNRRNDPPDEREIRRWWE